MANGLIQTIKDRLGFDAIEYEVPDHSNTLLYSLGGITLGAFVVLVLSGFLLSQFLFQHLSALTPVSIIWSIRYTSAGSCAGSISGRRIYCLSPWCST